MAVTDFVRRSMQIVAGGIVGSTTDYFDNAITFVNDVKEVMDMGKQVGSDSAKKFNELRHAGIFKKARDWFYNEGGMFGDFDFDEDMDDGGFEIESSDDDRKESEQPLSKQMMTDIAKKQTGAMYKAFGKQADLQIANTAEIVSTINTRTAELTASVNNVNNTLIQIGKRLDLIVEWTSARTKKEEEMQRKASILDYGGGISISGIANKIKEEAEDSFMGTMLSIGKNAIGSGMFTPEMAMSMLLSGTILNKQWKKLDNKSINDIGEFINDTIGEVIQNSLTKVLTSKNEILEGLFDSIISKTSAKNYQYSVANQYNDKPAVFDGMTRKSIITIIPGYLNEILKAVTNNGPGMNIDHKGNLTTRKSNAFVKEVSDAYFRAGTMGWKESQRAQNRTQLDYADIALAMKTMTACWIWHMYARGRNILDNGEVKDITRESTREVMNNTAELLAGKTKYSKEEWLAKYLPNIVDSIDEFKYRQEIQRSNQRADQNLETFAKTNVQGHQAGKITWEVLEQAMNQSIADSTYTPTNKSSVKATQIGSDVTRGITPMDVTLGILDKLNAGINVFITGSKRLRKAPYDPIIVNRDYAKNRFPGQVREGANNPIQETAQQAVSNVKDRLDTIVDEEKAKKGKTDPRYEEITSRPKSEWSRDDKEYIKEWNKKHNPNVFQRVGNYFAGDQRDYIVDPTMNELSQIFGERMDKIKNSTIVQKIFGSKAGQATTAGVGAAADVVGDAILGKRTWTQDGKRVRSGGFAHNAVVKGRNISDAVHGGIKSNKRLQEEWDDIASQYGSEAHFDQDNTDALTMQLVVSTMNTAMSDGVVSNMDIQNVRILSNKLSDRDLQKKINQVIIPMMKRNAKGEKDTSSDSGKSEGKSSLSMLGKLVFGMGKMVLRPIILYVKGVATAIFAAIKYVGGGILKLAKKGIVSGLKDIKSGTKSLVSGLKTVFKPVTKVLNLTLRGVTKFVDIANKGVKFLTGGVKKIFSGITSGIGKLFSRKQKGPQTQMEDIAASGTKSVFSKLGDKFKNSSFGSGFLKAYNERKDAQKQASVKEQAEPIEKALKDSKVSEVLTDTTGKKGFLQPLVDVVNKIFDKMPDKSESSESNAGGEDDKSKSQGSQMPDLYENAEGDKSSGASKGGGGGSLMGDVSEATPSSDLGGGSGGGLASRVGGAAAGAAGAAKSGISGLLSGIGEAVGGMTGILMGIGKILLTVVMSLEGFKALTKLITNILTESLKPLNSAFQMIIKTLKPLFKQLGGIIKQLAKFIVEVVEILMDVIKPILEDVVKPILEVLSPLLESILGVITPILKIVSILLKVIMAPLMGLFKFVLLPILRIIGDAVQIIMGVLQIGFGVLMMGIGAIVSAIGGLISLVGKIPLLGAVGRVGDGIVDSGKNMMNQGKEFVVQGGKSVAQGAVNLVLDTASLFTLGATDEVFGRNQEEQKETKQIQSVDEDTVKKTVANGDVTNIYNTYGGEYQRGMGGYLNMNQRGCGPIALADMYNRNHQAGVSARSLASNMYASGTYDPRRGTSVGGYIDSARSLGMNLTPGAVTQQTLKMASPTNPITVVGSGSDYGTRRGNNHFMNVIGTDHHGGAYVSNPLTGRVDRRPASTVAGSAVMGLYGSGDEEADGGYTFPDAIKLAFQKLKNEANKILGLFSMDKSDEEKVLDSINSVQNEEAMKNAKKMLKDDEYAKLEEEAKANARKDYEEHYPKRDGQSDEEYEKDFEEFWSKHSTQYLAEAGLLDKASENNQDAWKSLATASENFVNDYAGDNSIFDKYSSELDKFNSSIESLGSSGSGVFSSDEGVELWTPYSDNVEITETNIQGQNDYHSPLFEFFAKTMGRKVGEIYGSGWFKKYDNPNSRGEGQDGLAHEGIDFTGGHIEGEPLYATTGGTVKIVGYQADGAGNYVVWQDEAGKYHWYMHMKEPSKLVVGEKIEGGQLMGYVGTTGRSTGEHLHYTINTDSSGSGSGTVWNPLFYFKNYTPTGGDLEGDTEEEKIWAYLRNNGFQPHAAAGLMGNFQVEAGNIPSTLEGYYVWDGDDRKGPTAMAAMKSKEAMDDYVLNKLFPMYARSGRSINQGAYVGPDGHYYPGLGLAQWTGDRTIAMSDYTVGKGLHWDDLTGQLDFAKHEFDSVSRYKNALTAANNSNDAAEAARAFLNDYECNPGAALAERQEYAKQFLEKYKNWTGSKKKSTSKSSSSSSASDTLNAASAAEYDNWTQIKTTSGKNTGTVVAEGGLRLREGMGTDTSELLLIPNGTHLELEASGNAGWFKTTFGGKTGYVSSQYIQLDTIENEPSKPSGVSGGTSGVDLYLEAYAATKRTGAPGVTTYQISQDFQNWLFNHGVTWGEIVEAGNKLYTGEFEYGGPSKLWLWCRDNYGKSNIAVDTSTGEDFTTFGDKSFAMVGATDSSGFIGPKTYQETITQTGSTYGPQPFQNNNNNSGGSGSGGNSTVVNGPSQQTVKIPSGDARWQANRYKDGKYLSEWGVNEGGKIKVKPGGTFTNMAQMTNLLLATKSSQYYKNLQNDVGATAPEIYNFLNQHGKTADGWLNMRNEYALGSDKNKKYWLPDSLGNLHAAMYGSGDADDGMTELDFWNNYLGWNNSYANTVSPADSSTYNNTGAYWDDSTGTTVVNNWSITRAEDRAADARIRAILANTYNVRSDTMEAILAAILEELQRRRESGGRGNDTSGSTKLFDERIPSQVTKLSIG